MLIAKPLHRLIAKDKKYFDLKTIKQPLNKPEREPSVFVRRCIDERRKKKHLNQKHFAKVKKIAVVK